MVKYGVSLVHRDRNLENSNETVLSLLFNPNKYILIIYVHKNCCVWTNFPMAIVSQSESNNVFIKVVFWL